MKKILILTFISCIIILLTGCSNEFEDDQADYTIIKHLIDARLEIAGGMRVRELIIVEGDMSTITRTINYKLVPEVWDRETINLIDGAIYNGFSLENKRVSFFPVGESIDFDALYNDKAEFLSEYNLEESFTNFYHFISNEFGGTVEINTDVQTGKIGFYIEYLVSNIIVIHEDIAEIQYRFKNLDIGANQTWIRILLALPTEDENHHIWVRGPRGTYLTELVNEHDENLGYLIQKTNLSSDITIRMTMPKEHMMIPIHLNHSEMEALTEIIRIETERIYAYDNLNQISRYFRIIIMIIGVVYLFGSFFLMKHQEKLFDILYFSFGLVLIIFNFLFSIHVWWLYFIVILPIGLKIYYRRKYQFDK